MSGQGESTINLCATASFTSRTAQSARQHGVMHTLARSAQLLFGHRSHVGASRPSMTRPQGNDVTKNSGMFRTKTQRKQRKRNNAAPRCVRVARNREAQEESKPRARFGFWQCVVCPVCLGPGYSMLLTPKRLFVIYLSVA